MPKRKADSSTAGGSERGKTVVRAVPPRSEEDSSDDSDFCEIIEGPNGGSATPTSGALGRGAAATPPRPAPASHPNFAMVRPRSHHGPENQDVMSILAAARLSGPMPYMQPSHINSGFGFAQVGGLLPGQSFAYVPPGLLAHSAGFQPGGYFPGLMPHHQPAPKAAPPPSSSIVTSPVPQRVQKGAAATAAATTAAEEVKEEPDDSALRPTQAELPLVNALTQKGVPKDDALLSLRQHGHNVQEALQHALQTLCDRENSRREDMARYESEKDKEKIATERRQEDMTLTVLGDVAPRFQESFLLNKKEGCPVFRRAIHEMCSGEEARSQIECVFREKAVKLLFLERDALKWYRDVRPQVVGYFRRVAERLQGAISGENADGDDDDGESVEINDKLDQGQSSAVSRSEYSIPEDRNKTVHRLTNQIQDELNSLEHILFMIPSTSGGVPDAFLECNEHAATLEVDGVEEVCHQSASASRSRQGKDRVVVAIDDDG